MTGSIGKRTKKRSVTDVIGIVNESTTGNLTQRLATAVVDLVLRRITVTVVAAM